MLIASMNPCPCGYYNHPTKACVCSPGQVQKYLNKISGPLLDRIDIQIEIVPVPFDKISDQRQGESSNIIRQRVIKARQIQEKRYAECTGIYCNAQMNSRLLATYAQPDDKGLVLLKNAMERLNLSARAYDRILKVARTLPIWRKQSKYFPATWQKPSVIGISTGRTGQDNHSEYKQIKIISPRTLPFFIYLFTFVTNK